MKIIITGTPGTGKSTVAKELSKKLGIEIIDCKKIIERVKAYKFNEEGEMEVLLPKFRNALKKELEKKKNWIIESHLLCEIKIEADFVFVFRCEKKILEKRMKKRRYRLGKREDNIMVELLDYCFVKARRNLVGKLFELDTSKKSIKKCNDGLIEIIKGKRKKLDSVDYSKELINFVTK